MRYCRVIASVCVAASLPLASGFAQSAPLPEPPKWSFSLGVDPTHLDLHTPESGVDARMVVNLTRSWQSANSRLGRYVSLMVGMDVPREFNPSGDPQCDCLMDLRRNYSALTAGASYDLLRASRFTPYVKAGAGIYYIVASRDPMKGFLTPAEVPYYQARFASGFSLGVNGGLGLKARLGSHEFFIEQMIHSFDVSRRGMGGVAPLNIGVRF